MKTSVDLTFHTATVAKTHPLYRTQMIGRAQDLFVREHPDQNFSMDEVLDFAAKSRFLEENASTWEYTKNFLKNFSKPLDLN